MRDDNGKHSPSGRKEDYITVEGIVTPLFRRRRAFLIAFVGLFLLAGSFMLLTGGSYESHVSILVSRERMDPLVSTESTNQLTGNTPPLTDEEVNSEAELLKSRDVLEEVVIATGLNHPQPGFSIGHLLHPHETDADRIARAVKALAGKIKVETPTKTDLLEVSYKSGNPQLAYSVLKNLTDFYLEKHAEVHRPRGSTDFFVRQTLLYKNALESSEARLKELGEHNNIADPDEERTNLALQLATDIGQLHATEQAIAADDQRIRTDQQQLKATPERVATKEETNASDILLQQLGATELAAETRRTQLLLKYDESYPLVKEADDELAEVRHAIAAAQQTHFVNEETDHDPTFEMLREDLAKTIVDLSAQHATLDATRESIATMQRQMVQLTDQSLQVADLQREAKANEANYLLYQSKQEQERASDALDQSRIENISIAVPPAIPALPVHGPLFNLAIAFGVALLLGLALAYGLDYLDPSFHSPQQVRDTLGIPTVVVMHRRSA
jgi:polysaccharide biosynthesis transport protein